MYRWFGRRSCGIAAGACVAALATFGAAAPALASSRTHVASDGFVAHLHGAKKLGTTPSDSLERISVILKARNATQLSAAAEAPLTTPLTTAQFANAYGQSALNVRSFELYLHSYGIKTDAFGDRLDIQAVGTVAEIDAAFGITQDTYRVPSQPGVKGGARIPAQTVHGITAQPSLPKQFANEILAILGLTNYSAYTAPLQRAPTAKRGTSSDTHPGALSPTQCETLTGLPSACNLPSDFATNYGLNGMYSSGAEGQGETIGIVTLAALDPGAPQYFWTNIADIPPSNRTLTVDNVDGGPGAPSNAGGTGETDLDVEQSGAVAPYANVIDYQAPNTDPGFADAFYEAASQNIATDVSASWGESETIIAALVASGLEDPNYIASFDQAFEEMALQGQSAFTSAGDYGAYTAAEDIGTTNLAVGSPADSPYIVSAGGTTLPWSATLDTPNGNVPVDVTAERTWAWDYLWPYFAADGSESLEQAAESETLGGGGGYSTSEPEPAYQTNDGVTGLNSCQAVEYLTPTDYQTVDGLTLPTEWDFNPTPSVTACSGTGRVQPDISADADPFTGYLLYSPSFSQAGDPVLEGGWGGTSFVAPQLNGSAAVMDSYLGRRAGFWNPLVYPLAAGSSTPFTTLNTAGTTNDNLYYTGNPGTTFNPASGLGTPNLSAIGTALAAGGS